MPISSLIVRVDADVREQCAEAIGQIPCLTVSNIEEQGLVVIVETDDSHEDKALWQTIEAIEGVHAIELIYHNFEDLEGKPS